MAKAEWYEGKEGKAEHLVYLNKEGKEIDKLLAKEKTMIIRGAAGRKSPLGGRAKVDDFAYFVQTGGDLTVTHKGIISKVIESEKMTKEDLKELLRDEIRNIVIAHKRGLLTDEEYAVKMNAYNEIVKAVMS